MSNPQKYTVGWICAIATEYLAAQLFLDEEHEGPEFVSANDSNNYTLGKIGKHNVVVAVLPHGEYGISSATGVAKDMLHSFPNVRFGLMVGIGGGAPTPEHGIRLGDVVVSASGHGKGGVFQYDFGKAVQGQEFQETGFLNQPPTILRTAVHGLLTQYKRKGHQLDKHVHDILKENPRLTKEFQRPESSTDRLYHSSKVHPPNDQFSCAKVCGDDPSTLVLRSDRTEYEDNPAIHYGLIASADKLMKDALTRDALATEKGILCFEMEAAGLMNHFPCLVIRGICDYSDSHKNKEWQGFAAMMAAAYAKDLLCQIPPNKVDAEKPISEILTSIESMGNETKHTVMSMASDHRFAKIERWLSPPDCSTNANLARERRHPGTGTWLLNSPAFQEWKLGTRQHLWLYGLAGCGKTILSTTILDHLLQIDTHTTLAFFFDFNDPKKQKLENPLRSLAVQLYHAGNEGAKRLLTVFASHDDGRRQPDTGALSACINIMIQMAGKVFVIIDALDESLEQKPDFVGKKLSQGILDEIRDKIGDGADGIAIRLLQFLVYTKRPLTLAEAIEVIATEIDQEPRGFDVDGRLSLKTDILRYCPSLVIIARVTNYTKTVGELHLAHFSVKEYLLEQAQFDLESASIVITRTCLTYLSDIKNNYSTITRDFPMARYAAESWMGFAVSAGTSEEIVRITVRGADINAEGGFYGNALNTASSRGNREVVQLLLDRGADVNAQTLQAASRGGNPEIVQLLNLNGAKMMSRERSSSTNIRERTKLPRL
ncbi:ankyrin repeat protein [Fusarium bulbicola]|nr:ankyrin repeat protein [Fusarium bulbicola]